jgi:hypothetical protein
MKKIIFSILLCAVIGGASVFAFEGEDLKTYPPAVPQGSLAINLGAGFAVNYLNGTIGNIWIPPIDIAVDYALPIGGLAFFLGAGFEFSGSKTEYFGYTDRWMYFTPTLRFGYHFNFTVKQLDVYAAALTGWTFSTAERDGAPGTPGAPHSFVFGLTIGGRWFFIPNLGLYGEFSTGWPDLYSMGGGVTFRL